MQRCFSRLTLGAFVALSSSLFATDTVGAGWGADSVRTLPFDTFLAAHDTLASGDRIVFNGSLVWLEQDDGTFIATIGSTPPSFASFIELDPTGTFAILGESSNGVLYRIALAGGGVVPLTTLGGNYDLAYEQGAATAIVSAAQCGMSGCVNSVYRVDVTTGATTLLAVVPGPSGPVAISAVGDLYYATQSNLFPTPPGSVDVIRWSSAQITNGPFPLSQGQSTLFTGGLDGGSSMAFDPQFGHLFFGESVYGSTSRILEIDRVGAIVGECASSLDFQGKVELFDAPGSGALGAFQPAGARLQYRTTDFNQGTSQIVRISPRRPELVAVQNPGNTMTVTLTGGRPFTSAFVISGPTVLFNPTESSYDLATYLFWTGLSFPNIRRAGIQFPLDANGDGSFTFANPVSIQGTRKIQVLVRDANGVFRGSSTTITN